MSTTAQKQLIDPLGRLPADLYPEVHLADAGPRTEMHDHEIMRRRLLAGEIVWGDQAAYRQRLSELFNIPPEAIAAPKPPITPTAATPAQHPLSNLGSEQDERDKLRHLLEVRDAAKRDAAEARADLDRADEVVRGVEVELARYADLDTKLIDHTETAVRKGIPADPPFILENDLHQRSVQRDRLERSTAARARIAASLERAAARLGEADAAASAAARRVLACRSLDLLAELRQAEATVAELRASLSALAALHVGNSPELIALPWPVVDALQNPPQPVTDPGDAAPWRLLADTLLRDADADAQPLPAP